MNFFQRNKKCFVRILLLLILLALPCTVSISARADGSNLVDEIYATDGSLYPVIDYADLLTDDEEQSLAAYLYDIEERQQCSVIVLTLDSLGYRSPMEYADDFYDYKGYGYGEDHSGVILLLSMENRDYWFGTTGSAIKTFSDSDQEDIMDSCLSYISSGSYYAGFNRFAEECDKELTRTYEAGIFTPQKFLIRLLIGFGLALIPLFIFIAQLKTVHRQSGAADYTVGGLQLTRHDDRFIRSSISKTKIQKDSGGSSTHSGSSGTSHGGSGGHF